MWGGGGGAHGPARHRVGGSVCAVASHLAMAVGIGCAVLLWGVGPTVVLTVFFALPAGALVLSSLTPDRMGWRAAVCYGGVFGAAAVAVTGACAAFGLLGCLVLLPFLFRHRVLNAVVSSYWRDRLARRAPDNRNDDAADGEPVDVPSGPDGLGLLDDATLCLRWRESFFDMKAAASGHEFVRIVEQRRRYLDELQRRSPDGFAAWLASGPRATGDPMRFLRNQPPTASA